jgi:hypothetical protein
MLQVCNDTVPRESRSGFECYSAKMEVYYPFCVHCHRKMACNCEGTEQLQVFQNFAGVRFAHPPLNITNYYLRIAKISAALSFVTFT